MIVAEYAHTGKDGRQMLGPKWTGDKLFGFFRGDNFLVIFKEKLWRKTRTSLYAYPVSKHTIRARDLKATHFALSLLVPWGF